jgi:aspartyl-tRNA(Asn)/glutamyl-tRNA(Gln) amidotransferase subunit A
MSTPTDLADCSATQLLDLYRSGQASPVQATQAVLARIDRHNPTLRAFCHVAHEAALEARAPAKRAGSRARPVVRSTACRPPSRT